MENLPILARFFAEKMCSFLLLGCFWKIFLPLLTKDFVCAIIVEKRTGVLILEHCFVTPDGKGEKTGENAKSGRHKTETDDGRVRGMRRQDRKR
jgi:hypothetical protein